MAYRNLGTFLTKITIRAIKKIDSANTDEVMRIAENVSAWADAKTITSSQLDEMLAALDVGIEKTPDYGETNIFAGMTPSQVLASLSEQPTMAELGQAVSWLGIDVPEGSTESEIVELISAYASEHPDTSEGE